MLWDIASFSEAGERENNEDCIEVTETEAGICAVLCDGLGGHDCGELASACVCASIRDNFMKASSEDELGALACALIQQAQDDLREEQVRLHKENGMKTTVCCLLIRDTLAAAAYVGDSRIYHFRKKHVLSRSLDHSIPQYLVTVGEIKEREIRHHPDRNKLIRVMGSEWETPRYQRMELPELSQNDAFLLCSDGFWEWIEEKEMENRLKRAADSEAWLQEMRVVVYGRGRGNRMDNLSAIAIRARRSK